MAIKESYIEGQQRELNRLITAAVINQGFCNLLLTNPMGAIAQGYQGESFHLEPEELERIAEIRATNLADFTQQLMESQGGQKTP